MADVSDASLILREVVQADDRHLAIRWADGHVCMLDVVELRRRCPCAGCVDEWTREPLLDSASVPESVRPVRVRSVGSYGLSIEFDDGHSTGIYSFKLLRRLHDEPGPTTER